MRRPPPRVEEHGTALHDWYLTLSEEDRFAVRWAEFMERGPITRAELDAIMPPRRKKTRAGKKERRVSRLTEVGAMVRFQPEKAALLIRRKLNKHRGNVTRAADELETTRANMYLWFRLLGMHPGQARRRR